MVQNHEKVGTEEDCCMKSDNIVKSDEEWTIETDRNGEVGVYCEYEFCKICGEVLDYTVACTG